jgi:hypothetical protein
LPISYGVKFGRAASRAVGALASGYPLHHLRAPSGRFGGSASIPLAMRNRKATNLIITNKNKLNATKNKKTLSVFFGLSNWGKLGGCFRKAQFLFLKSSVARILKIKQARNNNRLIFPSYLYHLFLKYI